MLSARLVVAAAIGAALAVVLGYIVYAAPGHAISFGYWITKPDRWFMWPIFGALVGAGLTFVVQRR